MFKSISGLGDFFLVGTNVKVGTINIVVSLYLQGGKKLDMARPYKLGTADRNVTWHETTLLCNRHDFILTIKIYYRNERDKFTTQLIQEILTSIPLQIKYRWAANFSFHSSPPSFSLPPPLPPSPSLPPDGSVLLKTLTLVGRFVVGAVLAPTCEVSVVQRKHDTFSRSSLRLVQ